ncbi:MAG: hypothetical protein HKL92_07705 [Candidatus Eremiobacteraeota bacterium]|nr:hypothetical protein [Candidatus Eremiobacteraeota bacterium]
MTPTLLCFDRDLRLSDRALFAAIEPGTQLVPLLVLDRRRIERIARNPRRAAYFCAAVAALDTELRLRGSQVLVRRGTLDATIRSVARATGARVVAWSKRYDPAGAREDLRLQAIVEELGLRALAVHEAVAVDPERTAIDDEDTGFRSFNAFYRRWRAPESLRAPIDAAAHFAPSVLPSEPLPLPEEFGTSRATRAVGERVARAELERFVSDHLVEYARAMRTPSLPTSGLGIPLSFGLLSGRDVVRSVCKRLEDPFLLAEERAGIERFLRAMARRDFLLFAGSESASQPEERLFVRESREFATLLEARTGFPLVDAGMRELLATGTMHPAVRAVVASFCCFDLGLDWRVGMEAWEGLLTEDEPALAIGNWRWSAGLRVDMHFPRIIDPQRQFLRGDPQARYVRRWIPELALLSDARQLHAWHDRQLALDLFEIERYPRPMLDHRERAIAFLARYAEWRASMPPVGAPRSSP